MTHDDDVIRFHFSMDEKSGEFAQAPRYCSLEAYHDDGRPPAVFAQCRSPSP